MKRPRQALFVVHKDDSDPARVGAILSEYGFRIDRRCPNHGDPLPSSMEEHDVVVFFGGPQSVNDTETADAPGLRAELELIPVVLDSGTPFLGICLGAQLLAKALGARVDTHPDGWTEAGYYQVRPTLEGRQYFDGPIEFYQWHREGFDVPSGAKLLAVGDIFSNQAFKYGDSAYALQFHPEVMEHIIQKWTRGSVNRLQMPGAQLREAHFDGFRKYDVAVDKWTKRFLARIFLERFEAMTADAAD